MYNFFVLYPTEILSCSEIFLIVTLLSAKMSALTGHWNNG